MRGANACKGIDRIPEFMAGLKVAPLRPDSIAAFGFDRLYFCSRALKQPPNKPASTSAMASDTRHTDEHLWGRQTRDRRRSKNFFVVSRWMNPAA